MKTYKLTDGLKSDLLSYFSVSEKRPITFTNSHTVQLFTYIHQTLNTKSEFTDEFLNVVLNYLAEKPFKDVHTLVLRLNLNSGELIQSESSQEELPSEQLCS